MEAFGLDGVDFSFLLSPDYNDRVLCQAARSVSSITGFAQSMTRCREGLWIGEADVADELKSGPQDVLGSLKRRAYPECFSCPTFVAFSLCFQTQHRGFARFFLGQ